MDPKSELIVSGVCVVFVWVKVCRFLSDLERTEWFDRLVGKVWPFKNRRKRYWKRPKW